MLKIKVGLLTVEIDMERVTAIPEIIGPRTRLLVDCNHACNVVTAILSESPPIPPIYGIIRTVSA